MTSPTPGFGTTPGGIGASSLTFGAAQPGVGFSVAPAGFVPAQFNFGAPSPVFGAAAAAPGTQPMAFGAITGGNGASPTGAGVAQGGVGVVPMTIFGAIPAGYGTTQTNFGSTSAGAGATPASFGAMPASAHWSYPWGSSNTPTHMSQPQQPNSVVPRNPFMPNFTANCAGAASSVGFGIQQQTPQPTAPHQSGASSMGVSWPSATATTAAASSMLSGGQSFMSHSTGSAQSTSGFRGVQDAATEGTLLSVTALYQEGHSGTPVKSHEELRWEHRQFGPQALPLLPPPVPHQLGGSPWTPSQGFSWPAAGTAATPPTSTPTVSATATTTMAGCAASPSASGKSSVGTHHIKSYRGTYDPTTGDTLVCIAALFSDERSGGPSSSWRSVDELRWADRQMNVTCRASRPPGTIASSAAGGVAGAAATGPSSSSISTAGAAAGPSSAASSSAAGAASTADPGNSSGEHAGLCCVCFEGQPTYGFAHPSAIHLCVCDRCYDHLKQRDKLNNCPICQVKPLLVTKVHRC